MKMSFIQKIKSKFLFDIDQADNCKKKKLGHDELMLLNLSSVSGAITGRQTLMNPSSTKARFYNFYVDF